MLLKDIWEQYLVLFLEMHKVSSSQLAFQTSACVSWAHKLKRLPALTTYTGSSQNCFGQAWPVKAEMHFNRIQAPISSKWFCVNKKRDPSFKGLVAVQLSFNSSKWLLHGRAPPHIEWPQQCIFPSAQQVPPAPCLPCQAAQPMQLPFLWRDAYSLFNFLSPNTLPSVTGLSYLLRTTLQMFYAWAAFPPALPNINTLSKKNHLHPGRIRDNLIPNLNQKGLKLTACTVSIWISSIKTNIRAVWSIIQ